LPNCFPLPLATVLSGSASPHLYQYGSLPKLISPAIQLSLKILKIV
jgi:hypothetical protein